MATTKKPAVEEASKYDKRELLNAAKKFFGVKPEILAGALYGVDEAITVEEAKTRLEEFRKKEVK
ncbi:MULTISPECIES: hypothetical protein [Pelosinus]|uniref:YqzN/YkzM domain-containing protein n=1 Tax=Pelosinus fermentans B4 TaxID=1149862 RepID=I9LHD4_9FIRM|nr:MULTISPECIES: hypothetical protein [Pelosinus]EIW19914.1 hypothetical protein FB4_0165 [Pelosinus fermentans B4]EIW21229.1 hypothetical protein FA11_0956 [Pelosinus fermentans A11]